MSDQPLQESARARDTPRMPDRRQHDPHHPPTSIGPIETQREHDVIKATLPGMEEALAMMPRSSDLRLPLARLVSSMRVRVREFEDTQDPPTT